MDSSTIFWLIIAIGFLSLFIFTLKYFLFMRADTGWFKDFKQLVQKRDNQSDLDPFASLFSAVKHVLIVEMIGFILAAIAAFVDAFIID